MPLFLIPSDGTNRIVTFDVIEAEQHEALSEITDHPVETGSNVTDHVRPAPDRLSFVGFVSNHPIAPNSVTKRGELRTFKLEVPKYEPPFIPTPGAITEAVVAAIDGLIFGTPEYNAQVLAFPELFNAVRETFETLLELRDNAVLADVISSIRTYEDMVIERVAAPRTAGVDGVAFSVDLRRLRVVSTGVVLAPPVPAEPRGNPLANKGGQGTKAPGEDEVTGKSSIALNALQSLGVL